MSAHIIMDHYFALPELKLPIIIHKSIFMHTCLSPINCHIKLHLIIVVLIEDKHQISNLNHIGPAIAT